MSKIIDLKERMEKAADKPVDMIDWASGVVVRDAGAVQGSYTTGGYPEYMPAVDFKAFTPNG